MKEIIDVPECADLLGVTPQTVYRWVEAGSLPAMRAGRLIRFQRSEVLGWLRSSQVAPL